MDYFIGVDFGGTSVKLGVITGEGVILKKNIVTISAGDSFEKIMHPVSEWIQTYLKNNDKDDVKAIGIGTPGFIDKRTNILISGSENVPALKKHSVANILYEKTEIGRAHV